MAVCFYVYTPDNLPLTFYRTVSKKDVFTWYKFLKCLE